MPNRLPAPATSGRSSACLEADRRRMIRSPWRSPSPDCAASRSRQPHSENWQIDSQGRPCLCAAAHIRNGYVSGRLLDFAVVLYPGALGIETNEAEVAWETLVRCLNENRPVRVA